MKNRRKQVSRGGGGSAPLTTTARAVPNKRAQAVLRRANKPPATSGTRQSQNSNWQQPGLGLNANAMRMQHGKQGFVDIAFNRSGRGMLGMYASNAEARRAGAKPRNESPAKAKLRSAALRHMMGSAIDTARPGDLVTGEPTSESRARAYRHATKGAMGIDRAEGMVGSTRVDKSTWMPIKGKEPRKFNPNDLKEPLERLAKSSLLKGGVRLVGGATPAGRLAQGAVAANDALKMTTGKDAGDVKRRLERENIRQATENIRRRRKEKLPPNAAF